MSALRADAVPARASGVGTAHAAPSSAAATRRACSITTRHKPPPFTVFHRADLLSRDRLALPPPATAEPATEAAAPTEAPTEPATEPAAPHGTVGSGVGWIWPRAAGQPSMAIYRSRGWICASRPHRRSGDRVHVAGDRIAGAEARGPSRHGSKPNRSCSITPGHRVHLLSVQMRHGIIPRGRSVSCLGQLHNTEAHSPSREGSLSHRSCAVKSWQCCHLPSR